MSNHLRNQAETLAIMVEHGLATVADAVAWADAMIADEEHPHWSLCEVASMVGGLEPDVAHALREIPGAVDSARVQQGLLRNLAQSLASDRSRAESIAWTIYQLAIDGLLDGEIGEVALWASDGLELAWEGIIATPRDQIVDRMLAALQEASSASQT